MKRLLDVVASSLGLLLLSPFLLAAAAAVRLGSAGPVFYRGVRVGLNGKPFRIYKFRTMVADAERLGGPSTPEDDPRVTAAGAWLRRHKLDELPQLINVVLGDMSLVGPRPEVPQEVAAYGEEARRLLTVRPGITDHASIKFRNEGEILKGAPDPHKAYKELIQPEKIRLGLRYVDDHGVLGDVAIILRTLKAVIAG